jgi:hypothetical protein
MMMPGLKPGHLYDAISGVAEFMVDVAGVEGLVIYMTPSVWWQSSWLMLPGLKPGPKACLSGVNNLTFLPSSLWVGV